MPARKAAKDDAGKQVLASTVHVHGKDGTTVYSAGTAESAELRDLITADHVWVDSE